MRYTYKRAMLRAVLPITLLLSAAAPCLAAGPTMAVKSLKVLCVIYRGEPNSADYMDDQRLMLIKNGINYARLFYFRNSRCRLNLEITFLAPDATATGNKDGDLDEIIKDLYHRGIKDGTYDGIYITGIGIMNNLGGYSIMGGAGGATALPSKGADPDFPGSDSGTSIDAAWIFTHEFQHALDGVICEYSGHYEMLGGHPYGDRAASYFKGNYHAGGGWDWEGFTLENFTAYLDIKGVTKSVLTVADADQDGLPDDDPRLPTDEARLGSNPAKADTDGDGLSDLGEFCADRYLSCSFTGEDSDGDGIRDGEDPYPMVAIAPSLPYASVPPKIDGVMDKCYSTLISRPYLASGPGVPRDCSIHGCWMEYGLYFFMKVPGDSRPRMDMRVDGSAENGFWEGGDTYSIRATGNPNDTPRFFEWRHDIVKGAVAAYGKEGLELFIPDILGQGISQEINWDSMPSGTNICSGLRLEQGRKISLSFAGCPARGAIWFTPPSTMYDVVLSKLPTDISRALFLRAEVLTNQPVSEVEVRAVPEDKTVEVATRTGMVVGARKGSGMVSIDGTKIGAEKGLVITADLFGIIDGVKSRPFTLIIDMECAEPVVKSITRDRVSVQCDPGEKIQILDIGDPARPEVLSEHICDSEGSATVSNYGMPRGFIGKYYANKDCTKFVSERIDGNIDFNWGDEAAMPDMPRDLFGVVWNGSLLVETPGEYTFWLASDDGSRLRVDGELVIDNWGDHGMSEKQHTMYLAAGLHGLIARVYDSGGDCAIKLEYAGPGIARTKDLPVFRTDDLSPRPHLGVRHVDPAGNRSAVVQLKQGD